jgi:leucyl/phenylalanyl-tRNA--protein transferase
MPVYRLPNDLVFPDPDEAEEGLLAVGGDLRPQRLLLAYTMGIFPWYGEGDPILWHSPDPRCVLPTKGMRVGRTLGRFFRQARYQIAFDNDFAAVIRACQKVERPGQEGTWITSAMMEAYEELHRLGFAHSVEAWKGDELVGGVYGVSLGRVFFGESMFSHADYASRVALLTLGAELATRGFSWIDAQVITDTTRSLGAQEWPRRKFLDMLDVELRPDTLRGSWSGWSTQ